MISVVSFSCEMTVDFFVFFILFYKIGSFAGVPAFLGYCFGVFFFFSTTTKVLSISVPKS